MLEKKELDEQNKKRELEELNKKLEQINKEKELQQAEAILRAKEEEKNAMEIEPVSSNFNRFKLQFLTLLIN